MTRVNATALAIGLSAAMLVQSPASRAQGPPGGGGPRGGGGPGGSPMRLLQDPAVQTELKLTEKQKTQIKTLDETVNKRRRDAMTQVRNASQALAEQAKAEQQMQAQVQAEQNAASSFGGFGGGGIAGNFGGYGGVGAGGNGAGAGAANAGGGGNGGRGNRGGNNPNRALERQAMQEAMAVVQAEQEATLAKILKKPQLTRLSQIALQQEGLFALAREEVATKVNLSPNQFQQIQDVITGMRTSQREMWQANAQAMGWGRGGPGGQAGQNGGRQGGPPQLTDEQRAAMDKMREAGEKLRETTSQKIAKLLTKKQMATWKKMVGEPFDLAKLAPPPWGRPGQNRNGNNANGNTNGNNGGAGGADPQEKAATKGAATTKKASTKGSSTKAGSSR